MLKRFGIAMVAVASLGLAAAPVHAQLSKEVVKCQDGTNKTLGKFVGSKTKCFMKCISTQRKAASPAFASCFPPYADATVNACITGSLKGAEAKAGAGIAKVCAAASLLPGLLRCESPDPRRCTDASGAQPLGRDQRDKRGHLRSARLLPREDGGHNAHEGRGKV